MRIIKRQDGFTVIELLVAMAVFSTVLIVVTVALMQIGNMYYKGVNSIKTQETARDIVSTVSEQLQFRKGNFKQNTTSMPASASAADQVTVESRCIGGIRYSFVLQLKLVDGVAFSKADQSSPHVLWQDVDESGECLPVDITQVNIPTSGRELAGENMRLINFDINKIIDPGIDPYRAEVFDIWLSIVFGDNDLLARDGTGNATGCEGGLVGAQWCAQSELTTQVTRRIL